MMVGPLPSELEEEPVSPGGELHPCFLAHHSLRFTPLLRFFCFLVAHQSLEFCLKGIIFKKQNLERSLDACDVSPHSH